MGFTLNALQTFLDRRPTIYGPESPWRIPEIMAKAEELADDEGMLDNEHLSELIGQFHALDFMAELMRDPAGLLAADIAMGMEAGATVRLTPALFPNAKHGQVVLEGTVHGVLGGAIDAWPYDCNILRVPDSNVTYWSEDLLNGFHSNRVEVVLVIGPKRRRFLQVVRV